MKNIILIVIGWMFISCNNYKNRVNIINNNKIIIDSIIVYGNKKCTPLIFKNISKESSKILNQCSQNEGDGSYSAEIFFENKIKKQNFGYYTNGVYIFKEVNIIIEEEDSITIKYY